MAGTSRGGHRAAREVDIGQLARWTVCAFGIPGIAVISQTTQAADNKGEDTNVPVQANPVDVGQ